jgi:hypothetical protein
MTRRKKRRVDFVWMRSENQDLPVGHGSTVCRSVWYSMLRHLLMGYVRVHCPCISVWTTDGLWTRLLLLLWTQNSCSALLLNVVFHCWLQNGISRLKKLSYCLQFPCVIRTFCIVQWTSLAYLIYQDVWYIRSCYIRTRMNGTAETLLRPSI